MTVIIYKGIAMKLDNAIVLVTGANRGLGQEFARQALAHGARKVYAAARDPGKIALPGVVPVRLDVNDQAQAAEAAAACADVTLVINNAGIASDGSLLDQDSIAAMQRMMETNVYGMLRVSQAFAPRLAANGGGAFLNVLSVASWISTPGLAAYAATKSAAWSVNNGLRIALKEQGTQVLGLHVGPDAWDRFAEAGPGRGGGAGLRCARSRQERSADRRAVAERQAQPVAGPGCLPGPGAAPGLNDSCAACASIVRWKDAPTTSKPS